MLVNNGISEIVSILETIEVLRNRITQNLVLINANKDNTDLVAYVLDVNTNMLGAIEFLRQAYELLE